MKAVVLARGLGTRMKAGDDAAVLTPAQASVADMGIKALVPLDGDRPFLDYILSALADAGCTDICLVIGPEHDLIRDRYTRVVPPHRFSVGFAIQEQPRGTGDALLAAEAFVENDEFVMTNGDNYYPVSALRTLVALDRPGAVFFTPRGLHERSNIEPERIRAFALGVLGADGFLERLIEKPDAAFLSEDGAERHISMNCWRLPPAIFDACRSLSPSARGEIEITEAVNVAIARGVRFEVRMSDEGVLDLSRRSDIETVRERLRSTVVRL